MIVADTNVIVRGIRSRNGASHRVLRAMVSGELEFALSPAVVLEYEDVLTRPGMLGDEPWLSHAEIGVVLDALCARCVPSLPWFRFRPFLDDPKDEIFIECALAAGARVIVTDDRHFRHPTVEAFGLRAMSAPDFEVAWRHERTPQ